MSPFLPAVIGLWVMLAAGVSSHAAGPRKELVSGEAAGGKSEEAGMDDEQEGPAPAPQAPKPLFHLDAAKMSDGSSPVGANVVRGKWRVKKAVGEIVTGDGDLEEGWLEFGPVVRESAAAIRATLLAPGGGRLRSRAGVGLYGRNGFEIRAVMAGDRIELVRRGEVLAVFQKKLAPAKWLHLELQVVTEGDDRVATARAWHEDEARPEEPQLSHALATEALLFPLAGRPVLTATPFSREPVRFRSVELHAAPYDPAPVEPEEDGEIPKGDDKPDSSK